MAGCATLTADVETCLELSMVPQLSRSEGEPRVTPVTLYALGAQEGFLEAEGADLLAGTLPDSVLGEPVLLSIAPGEARRVDERFPAGTRWVGVVADFSRPSGDPSKLRRIIVEARCPRWRRTSLLLTGSDLRLR